MDLSQHLAVLSRHKKVLIASAVLGIALAVLFTLKLGPKGPTWRHDAKWESSSRLFVTQSGFAWGRTTLPDGTEEQGLDLSPAEKSKLAQQANDPNSPKFAEPGRLSLLAIIYAFISQSNTVGTINSKPLPAGEEVTAVPLSDQNEGALPLMDLKTTAATEGRANALNTERTKALMAYLAQQQDANDVAPGERVKLAVLNKPFASQVSGHGEMLGIAMIFLAIAAGVAASYLLESLRLSRERAAATDRFNGELVDSLSWSNTPASGSSLHDAPQRSIR